TAFGLNSAYERARFSAIENSKSQSQNRRLWPARSLLAHGFRSTVCALFGGAGVAQAPGDVARAFLDSGGHGRGAERGDGLQPFDGPEIRCAQSAHAKLGAAARH